MTEKLLLSTQDVLHALSVGRTQLYELLDNDPDFPKPKKRGNTNIWHADDIRRYADRFRAAVPAAVANIAVEGGVVQKSSFYAGNLPDGVYDLFVSNSISASAE